MNRLSRCALAVGCLLLITSLTDCGGGETASPASPPPAPQVATVTVSPSATSIAVGATMQLSPSVLDANGATLSGHAVTWSSGAPSIATVSTSGLVTGVSAGTASITATSDGKSGAATVTVLPPVATVFNPTTATTLSGTQRFASINIPAGVTVTVTSDLDLSASGATTIAGTLTGNCVAMTITADGSASVTGAVSNTCSDPNADGKNLTIVGKGGIAVTGTSVNSSGDILITNDLTLTDASFPTSASTLVAVAGATRTGAAARAATAVAPDCAFAGVRPAPPPGRAGAPSEKQFLSGGAGKALKMACRGNGDVGGGGGAAGAGGATITAQAGGAGGGGTSVSNSFAEARAGDGGNGGSLSVFVTGDLTISGITNLISGDGGDGGAANATGQPNPSLNKQPSAQATGGKGGDPGLVDIRVGGSLNINAALNIVIGRAGDGGSAVATAANGLDATDTSPAKEGGDANPTGGEGGGTPNRTLVARGAVAGLGAVNVAGGRAGNAGRATGTAGLGGTGNEKFPTGGKGGSLSFNTNAAGNGSTAHVGNGGNALLKNLAGAMFGRGGDGSVTSGTIGNGGRGWSDCGVPRKPGGSGGQGGSAAGHDGKGGIGAPNGIDGGITFTNVGNGGNGGNGQGPGAGGNPGTDASTSALAKTLNAPNFTPGVAGNPCAPVPVNVAVKSDPNGHEPFVGYTRVKSVSVTTDGSAIAITGAAPWVTVTGQLDANNNFVATGSGTVAGFSNVPVTFTGSISATGALSGTIQIGQNTPPTGLPNGAVTYTITPGG